MPHSFVDPFVILNVEIIQPPLIKGLFIDRRFSVPFDGSQAVNTRLRTIVWGKQAAAPCELKSTKADWIEDQIALMSTRSLLFLVYCFARSDSYTNPFETKYLTMAATD